MKKYNVFNVCAIYNSVYYINLFETFKKKKFFTFCFLSVYKMNAFKHKIEEMLEKRFDWIK